ncbi:zinc finger protein 862-like [Argopecten irradians]
MGTDGASVMLGNKSGVVKRMAELTNRPFLKGIHCSAHRLELAYKDAVKGISIHQKCELLLTNLYLFYKYSPLNRSNLNIAAESLKKSVKVPSRPGGTRWLPHTQRAIKTVLDGADVIILHLEQIQQEPRKEASAKARNFLKVLKDKSSRFWLHLMLDVVKALSHVSVTIQNNTCTLADIYSELESVKQILQKYKTSDGPFLRTLTESTEDEFSSLGSTRIRLLDSIIDKLTVRFGGDSALFRASSILCVDKWPKDFSTDIEYGDEHVCAAVNISGPALRESCPNMDVEAIETEWTRLKTTLTTRKHTVTDLTSLEGTFGESFPNLFLLLNFLLTQPGSSVEAERGFSCMKMVKSDWRSRLGEQNLSDLMMVTLELPEVGKFDPLPCVELWYGSGQRARRPFYKDELKKCYLPRETDTSDHESMVEVSAEIRGEAVIPDDGMMMDDSIEDDNVVPDEDLDALVEGETENYDASDDDDEDEEAELSRKDLIAMQQRAYRMFLDMIC